MNESFSKYTGEEIDKILRCSVIRDLPEGANLNEIYEPGIYRCDSNAKAKTITGIPYTNNLPSSFVMYVIQIAGFEEWGGRFQIVFNYSETRIAIRESRLTVAPYYHFNGYYNWLYINPSKIDNDIKSQKTLGIGDSIILGWRNNYWSFLSYIGNNKNNALGGAKYITDSSYGVKNIPQQLLDETDYSPDNIITGTGLNYWALNSPLGTLPTAVATNDTAANALDRTTVYGAMQFLFYQMVKKFPSAKRFFVTATKFDCNVNVDIHGKWTDTNSQGYSYKDMLEGIKHICELYGVVYIDVLNKGFVNSEFAIYKAPTKYEDVQEADRAEWNSTYYIDADGLHPTDRCYREVYAPIVHEVMGITQHFHEYQKD
jgi:hypothetical protein